MRGDGFALLSRHDADTLGEDMAPHGLGPARPSSRCMSPSCREGCTVSHRRRVCDCRVETAALSRLVTINSHTQCDENNYNNNHKNTKTDKNNNIKY